MACEDLVSNQDLENAKKDTNTMSDFVESSNPSTVSKSGKQIRTLQGINDEAQDAINSFKIKSKGQYLPSPLTLDDAFEYVVFGDKTYFAVSPPYTTDPVTFPDPASDTINLIEQSYLTRGQAEIIATTGDEQLAGLNIWPVNPQVSAQVGDSGLVDVYLVRDSLDKVLYKTSVMVSGAITAIDFGLKTATIGAVPVTLSQWNIEQIAQEQAHAGDSQLANGEIYPVNSANSASATAPFNDVPVGAKFLRDSQSKSVFRINPIKDGVITSIDFNTGLAVIGGVSVRLSLWDEPLYANSESKSAVENMVDDFELNTLSKTIKTIISTGGTNWQYEDASSPITIDNFIALDHVNLFDFKDESTGDDWTAALQSAVDTSPRVNIFIPPRIEPYDASFIDVGAKYGSDTRIKISGYGATIKATQNNIALFTTGSASAILENCRIEGLELDLRNVTGCTAVRAYNYRRGSGLHDLVIRMGADTANGNIGVHLDELNWDTEIQSVKCFGGTKGFLLDSSSNTVNLLSCSADGCDIGVHIRGGTYVTTNVSVTNGYYQLCRIAIWDEGAWHTSLNNVYMENNSETDVFYDGSLMPYHVSSLHLTDDPGTTGIKGRNCRGASINGAAFTGQRLNNYDFDSSNEYCRAEILRSANFGVVYGIVDGLKAHNNMNGDPLIGDTGIVTNGNMVGVMGTSIGNQREVSIGNGFDATRTEFVGTPINVQSSAARIKYIIINANAALTTTGTPIDGQSILLCMRSNATSLTVTLNGKAIDWSSHPGGTANGVCEAVYIGAISQWMIGATWWS